MRRFFIIDSFNAPSPRLLLGKWRAAPPAHGWRGLLAALPLLLTGCNEMIGSAATGVGVAAAEERSLGTVVDDKTIYADITNRYIHSDVNDLLVNVEIRVNEGRVLLTGIVDKPETSVEAARIAWEASGVREVINEVKTQRQNNSGLGYAEDAWIAAQLKARLLATKHIISINYTIQVVDKVVYLLGIAQNEEELKNVAYIASITQGVKRVVSYVRLKNAPPPAPPQTL